MNETTTLTHQPIEVQNSKEPGESERAQVIRQLEDCFNAATFNLGSGGGDSSHRAGSLEAANYMLLTKDQKGIFGVKVGWSDFVATAEGSRELGPARIQQIGPVFVLPQFDAFLLEEAKLAELNSKPTDFMFNHAEYLVVGDRIYRNTHGKKSSPLAVHIEDEDFNDPNFREKVDILPPEQYIQLMRNRAVNEYIGRENFELLMNELPQGLTDACTYVSDAYWFYSEKFSPFLNENNDRYSGRDADDIEEQKETHLQYVKRYNSLLNEVDSQGQSTFPDTYQLKMQAIREVAPDFCQKAIVATTLMQVCDLGIETVGIAVGDAPAVQSLLDLRDKYDFISGRFVI